MNIGGHADDKEQERKGQRKRKSKQISQVNVTSELAAVHQDEHVESRKLGKWSLGSAYSCSLGSVTSSKSSSQKVTCSSLNSASLSICEDRSREKQLVCDFHLSDEPVHYSTSSEKSSLLPSDESIYDSKRSHGSHFIQETSLLDADDTANSSSQSFNSKVLKLLNTEGAPIPIGPRFQVDVPDWSGPIKDQRNEKNSEDSKWLCTRMWPLENRNTRPYKKEIGQGRPDNCSCDPPGSIDCVKLHILEESQRLQSEIGLAFWSWRFDDMGESVTKSWTSKQRDSFDSLVKTSVKKIKGLSYWKLVSKYLRTKDEKKLASYYLNVFIPRRMSLKSRQSLQQQIDSDEEEDSNDVNTSSKQGKGKRSSLAKHKYLQWNH